MNIYKKVLYIIIDAVIIVLFVTAVVQIGQYWNVSWNLNRNDDQTLRPEFIDVLEKIDKKIKVTVFINKEGEQEIIRDSLDHLASKCSYFDYEIINMDRNPRSAEKYDVHSYLTTVVEYNGEERKTSYPSVENICELLSKMLNKVDEEVAFLLRKNEIDFSEVNNGRHGYDFARMRLLKEGYKLKMVPLLDSYPSIKGCKVAVVMGVRDDLNDEECNTLEKLIQGGINIVFFLDPVALPRLEEWLEKFGIFLPRKIIVDEEGHPPQWDDYTIIVPFIKKTHPIAQGIEAGFVFPFCRPVEINRDITPSGIELVGSGKSSYTSSSMEGEGRGEKETSKDVNIGPIPVGIVSDSTADGHSKIIVYGNSLFFDNTYIKLLDNGKLFINTINYLNYTIHADRKSQNRYGQALMLSRNANNVLIIVCGCVPILIIFIGVMIKIRERIIK